MMIALRKVRQQFKCYLNCQQMPSTASTSALAPFTRDFGAVSQYQPKSNTPKTVKIRTIPRKFTCKVLTLLHSFSKNITEFLPLLVKSILREQIFS